MNILGLDIEGAYGIMNPDEEGFYTSCVGLVLYRDGEVSGSNIVWIEHNGMDRTPDGIAIIQKYVDVCDLIVGQNLKYDIKALTHYGVNFDKAMIWDTMLAEYILSGMDSRERKFGLNALANWYGIEGKGDAGAAVRSYWDDGVDTCDIPYKILSEYQINDCIIPINIYEKQLALAEQNGMRKSIELQMEWLLSLCEMEYNGIAFNMEKAYELRDEYKAKANEIQQYFREYFQNPHINLGSGMQKSAVVYGGILKTKHREWYIKELKSKPESLYREHEVQTETLIKGLGFPAPKDKKKMNKNGYYKVDIPAIESLPAKNEQKREWKRLLLLFGTYTKIHETLVGKSYKTGLCRKVSPDGKVHCTLEQCWARTGRLTSKNPNGQNLFPIIKVCFEPTLDYIGQVDLSQIEWRAGAELAKDRVMINEVNSGVDQHVATVRELMEMEFIDKTHPPSKQNRNHAKVFNFRMIFGGTEWGFHLDINMPKFGLAKWRKTIAKFWKKYRGLANFHANNIKHVLAHGTLRTITGRLFKFDKCAEVEGELTYSYNQIRNRPIQGTAAEMIALVGVIIRRGMKANNMKSKMILTVHDSIVFDIAKGEEDMIKNLCLRTTNSLREYIQAYWGIEWETYLEGEFEIGPNYGEQREVKLNQTCKEVMYEL